MELQERAISLPLKLKPKFGKVKSPFVLISTNLVKKILLNE